MRAVCLHTQGPIEDRPLRREDRDDPIAGPGEVRIAVSACGACRTDLHIVEGDLPPHRLPLIPGHQIVGVIDAVGEGVAERRLGERVGVPWMSSSCGECELCAAGRTNLCAEARFTGYDIDGGYAELAVVPQGSAHPVPDVFADVEAAPLLCAGMVGFRSLRLSEVEPGQRLGLFGFGASAHVAIQVARHWGCEVFVFTRGEHHRELAERLGAAWVGDSDDDAPEPLNAAVVFAPAGVVVRRALEALGPGGTVAVNAIHMDEIPPLDYRDHLYGERTLRSVTNLTASDADDFLRVAAEVPVSTTVESFSLDDANDVLLRMKESRLKAAAVLVP